MNFKNLFRSPLKAIFTIVSLFVIVALLITGSLYGTRAYAKSHSIGEENAKQISFADAGVDPGTAEVVQTDFEYENGHFAYEVDFIADNTEYDYWIKANDGAILDKSIETVSSDNKKGTTTVQITLEKAKEIALSDAKLTGSAVTFTTAKLDSEDGLAVYDIDFHTDSTKYEYEIDANTGKIRGKDVESIRNNTNNNQNQTNNDKNNNNSSKYIGIDQAKSIAVKDAGRTLSNVSFTKAELDTEDGIALYEIEFNTDNTEYEYEINATTGEIHEKFVEPIKNNSNNNQNGADDDKNNNNSSKYIGIDKAKNIATKHAGLSISDVTFTKAKLDTEDGKTIYDIEFYKDGTEYDYEIDASSGKILDHDTDKRD